MGVSKGINNFLKYQRNSVQNRTNEIEAELDQIPSSQIFTSMSGLIGYISKRINVHRTTLTRNKAYYSLIEEKFISQKGAEHVTDAKQLNEQQLLSNLKAVQTELELVLIENRRLKKQLARQLSSEPILSPSELRITAKNTSYSNHAFENTARSLNLLLEHLATGGLGIEFDRDSGAIIDISKNIPSERNIVPERNLREFLRWKSSFDV